ncbi:hypothetical protein Bca52824_016593 [Brassica carinata]|uniref:Uncharacterized protein n=1 Tax=Brassica carinata TaxID=52824 RepID=A0A8X8B5K1_BRACI|nr:hypothetical protein Bca52824_016593 [Brassica carinata]
MNGWEQSGSADKCSAGGGFFEQSAGVGFMDEDDSDDAGGSGKRKSSRNVKRDGELMKVNILLTGLEGDRHPSHRERPSSPEHLGATFDFKQELERKRVTFTTKSKGAGDKPVKSGLATISVQFKYGGRFTYLGRGHRTTAGSRPRTEGDNRRYHVVATGACENLCRDFVVHTGSRSSGGSRNSLRVSSSGHRRLWKSR